MARQTDMQKGLVFMFRGTHITAQILAATLRSYLSNQTPKKGNTSLKLLEKNGTKLESIEVTEKNIGSFLQTARNYNIDYALKRDKSTVPPTWYVFFKTGEKSVENLKRAFGEYTANVARTANRQVGLEQNKPERKRDREIIRQKTPPEHSMEDR